MMDTQELVAESVDVDILESRKLELEERKGTELYDEETVLKMINRINKAYKTVDEVVNGGSKDE